jgi:hypothetical protein
LKILGELIEKDVEGRYHLTEKGRLASELLQTFPERIANEKKHSLAKIVVGAVLIIVGVLFLSATVSFVISLPTSVVSSSSTTQETSNIILRANITQFVRITQVLDSGRYARYDFSTASNLLEIMKTQKEEYGDLEELPNISKDSYDLERRLQELKGVGPVCVNIFLRELRTFWDKAMPKPSAMTVSTAQRIGLKNIGLYESAVVRINLEYCKKGKYDRYPVGDYCKKTEG